MKTPFLTHKELFQRWMAVEGSKPFQALSTEPDSIYENIWNAWLESLQPVVVVASPASALPVRRHWHEAQAEDVSFIEYYGPDFNPLSGLGTCEIWIGLKG